jgi:tRNA nucleotidyltransferase/poly(A) polymerase
MFKDDKLNEFMDILLGILGNDSVKAYIVGGAVRELLRAKTETPIKDIDLAIDTDPYVIAKKFAKAINGTYVPLNKRFMTARVVKGDYIFDISALHNGSISDDLKRRDFTINALAIDLTNRDNSIIDIFGGIEDTSNHLIKMISRDNFIADPVRLIRAFRFMASLEFKIEHKTIKAIKELKHLIKLPAIERITAELKILLASNNAFDTIRVMAENEFLFELIPEIKLYDWTVNLKVFQDIESIINNPNSLPYNLEMQKYFMSSQHIKIFLKFSTLIINTQNINENLGVIEILNRFKVSVKEARYTNLIIENITYLYQVAFNRITALAASSTPQRTEQYVYVVSSLPPCSTSERNLV